MSDLRALARARRAHPARAVGLALAALGIAPQIAWGGPRDPLYRWTDGDGAVRYTTERARIPADARDDAVRVELPPEPEPPMPSLGPAEPERAPQRDGAEALPPVEAPRPADAVGDGAAPSALEMRITALEREIAAVEAALTEHISDPERAARLHDSDEVAAIAERLPRLQAELRALREQRDAAVANDGP